MKKAIFVLVLLAAGCCSHSDVAREAMRINAHLVKEAPNAAAAKVAQKNYNLWAEVAGVTSAGK